MSTQKFSVEYEIELKSSATRSQIVRAAKKIAGWTGTKCHTCDYGDLMDLRPDGECLVMFISEN